MSSSGDSGPGTREVAYRLFAAEFDDCSLSYAESDDERAPNYVVTPTGLRVNRLFAVGVLTETEAVNDETLRGRIVDPTGAFVTYAGQYQPEAQAFLDGTTPPAFVAITGKARTFEPEDSDRVFTSVRPESLSEVEASTRDRWVVSAAESTLRRIAICAAALDSPLDGEQLQQALADAGVDESLAAGIPRAIEHYGTTTGYLAALRQLAVDALEVVADEREEVRPLDVAPDEDGDASVGPLPAVELELEQLQTAPQSNDAASSELSEPAAEPPTETPTQSDDAETASTDAVSTDDVSSDTEPADGAEPAASSPTDSTASAEQTESTASAAAETAEAVEAEPSENAVEEPSSAEETATSDSDTDTVADPTADTESTTSESDSEPATEPPADDSGEAGMYQLDEEERAELESEYDTGFSSGNEVDPAGEAGIDVPDADELAEQIEETDTAESTSDTTGGDDSLGSFEDELGEFDDETPATETSTDSTDEASAETEPDTASDQSTADATEETADTASDASTETTAEDIDLDETVVSLMAELDDGDGVEHEVLTDELIDRYGVTETAIEEAIADALMGGRCYETGDDTLKAI